MDSKEPVNEFVSEFANTIINCNSDVLIDIGEIGIDSPITNEMLQQFPVAKTIYAFCKTGIAIREHFLLMKTYNFIKKLNSNNLNSKDYEDYKNRLKNSDKELYKELERLIIILDKIIEPQKAIILANFYSAYINKFISFKELQDFYTILDNLLLNDICNLKLVYESDRIFKVSKDRYGVTNRLISLGLLYIDPNNIHYDKSSESLDIVTDESKLLITEYGKKFYKYGFI